MKILLIITTIAFSILAIASAWGLFALTVTIFAIAPPQAGLWGLDGLPRIVYILADPGRFRRRAMACLAWL